MLPFDESRLTAYALRELPESERAEVEREIMNNPEARAFVEETRAFGEMLRGEFMKTEFPASEFNNNAATAPANAAAAPKRASEVQTLRFWRMVSLVAAALVLSTSIYTFTAMVNGTSQANTRIIYNIPLASARTDIPAKSYRGPGDSVAPQSDLALGFDGQKPGERVLSLDSFGSGTNNTITKDRGRGHGDIGFDWRGLGDDHSRQLNTLAGTVDKLSAANAKDELYLVEELSDLPKDNGAKPSSGAYFNRDTDGLSQIRTEQLSGESYNSIIENKYFNPRKAPLSTFSIDVDTASYANTRRFLTQNSMPPADAVRVEELLNYFTYNYAPPTDGRPFAVHLESAACPWNLKHKLVRVALKAKAIANEERKPTNLVFLVDVSGSMAPDNKLPLLKEGLKLLVRQLGENDNVSIVTYAGSCGVALAPTNANQQTTILNAIEQLQSGGSTNGASGIQLAYDQAVASFIKNGVNRVLLMTDGDFNVGITDPSRLNQLITEKAKSGVFLSVLGFGMGNVKDSTMEQLADKGNGNYAYIDTLREARKVLVDQMNGTLVTVAKDVKIQVEFNPAKVAGYRLIGYENRALAAQDFNNDKKDAGEIGAGHSVTALYEIVPVGAESSGPGGDLMDNLRYQTPAPKRDGVAKGPSGNTDESNVQLTNSTELLNVKIRYKQPDGDKSTLMEVPLVDNNKNYSSASEDYKFAAAVAEFGMLLRDSRYKGTANWDAVLELAEESKGADPLGYRREFIDLAMKAKSLSPASTGTLNALHK